MRHRYARNPHRCGCVMRDRPLTDRLKGLVYLVRSTLADRSVTWCDAALWDGDETPRLIRGRPVLLRVQAAPEREVLVALGGGTWGSRSRQYRRRRPLPALIVLLVLGL